MTKGQIIDQLNIMGYKVLVGDNEIIVKKDHQHTHSFHYWSDVESYYNLQGGNTNNLKLTLLLNILNNYYQSNHSKEPISIYEDARYDAEITYDMIMKDKWVNS